MITILIPTLDWYNADETGQKALACAGVDAHLAIEVDPNGNGFTSTVNTGLRKHNGDDIVLLNDDCELTDDWLATMIDEMQRFRNHHVWFVGPSGPCRTMPQNTGRKGDRRKSRLVPHLAGFCLLMHRDAVSAFGELDSRFIHYASDVDIQRKAARHYKARSLWVPEIYCDHELHLPHMKWWTRDQELLNQIWR